MTCSLCGGPPDEADAIDGAHVACRRCGCVRGTTFFQTVPSGVSDGWQARAAHLGPSIPKQAIDAGLVSVDALARMLEAGPLYIETPNTKEPRISLAHFFRGRSPVYYEPATLGIALAMAGADDLAIDEVAGMITCVAVGGGQRLTYEDAVASTGIEPPRDVAARMLAHFAPKPPETMGDAVPGECFLCGGVRRAWRSVTICETCSATTTHAHGPLLDELSVKMAEGGPVQFLAPDMRTNSPADCEMVTVKNTVMLDEAGWAHALVMAGADVVRAQKHSGALELQGTTLGTARRKTFAEASDVVVKLPLRAARHTLAVWNTPVEQASRYELWIVGEDCDDLEYLRAEAKRDRLIASAAVEALEVLMHATEAPLDDPDDWHPEPYLNGFRMGAQSAWQRAQAMLTAAWMACVWKTVRDE
jgi:hypothetical protein